MLVHILSYLHSSAVALLYLTLVLKFKKSYIEKKDWSLSKDTEERKNSEMAKPGYGQDRIEANNESALKQSQILDTKLN